MKQLALISALLLAAAPTAMADGWKDGFTGEASLSGNKTTGNTDTTDAGAAIKLAKTAGQWKTSFNTSYDLGQVNGQDTRNRWSIGLQVNRQINDGLYAYANGTYFTDDFGPFKNSSFVGGGLGYDVINNDDVQWSVEAGTGWRSQRSRGTVLIYPATETSIAAQGKSTFNYKFNDNVSLYNNSEVIWSDSDTFLQNETGITAKLMGKLAARFSFHVDHHSDVPMGVENTDTITRAALVYTLN